LQRKFAISEIFNFKQRVLNWSKLFSTFCFLDSNQYAGEQEWLIGAGIKNQFMSSEANALENFQQFQHQHKCWLFGHLGYELNTIDSIARIKKKDALGFQNIYFFEPEIVLIANQNEVEIIASHPLEIFMAICNSITEPLGDQQLGAVQCNVSRDDYLKTVLALKAHIQRGDCYEINFCIENFSENASIDPVLLYDKLNRLSPNPFSGLYRTEDKWLICASPERYLKKTGNKIISQPIKGTLKRTPDNLEAQQQQLLHSSKDRAENVMVVDLVRNDLSRICREGSVQVEELFGIYSFPQVHQMISTIKGQLKEDIRFTDIINATFPMGSMTGAPKIKVMKLIEQYEKSKRGIFSGSIGFIKPNGDFDFNVVIRSIMYNQQSHYLSWQAGSGITIYSNPENEWEECMVKVEAIKEILSQ